MWVDEMNKIIKFIEWFVNESTHFFFESGRAPRHSTNLISFQLALPNGRADEIELLTANGAQEDEWAKKKWASWLDFGWVSGGTAARQPAKGEDEQPTWAERFHSSRRAMGGRQCFLFGWGLWAQQRQGNQPKRKTSAARQWISSFFHLRMKNEWSNWEKR